MRNEGITHTEKHLLEVLSGYGHDDGTSIRPGITRIVQDMGCTGRCVKKNIKSLLEKHLLIQVIKQKKGSNKPHQYSLNLVLIKSRKAKQISSEFNSLDANPEKITSEPNSPVLGNVVHFASEPDSLALGNAVHPNKDLINNEKVIEQIPLASSNGVCDAPSIEPSTPTKSRKLKSSKKPNPYNDAAFSEVWNYWLKKERMQKAREEFYRHAVLDEMRNKILKAAKIQTDKWSQDNTPHKFSHNFTRG